MSLPVNSDVSWHLLSLVDSLLGAMVGASFIYGAGAIYLRARGVEGMGFGDVKLMAMVGAFLGAKLTIFTLFSASIAGSLFGLSTVSGGVDQAHPPADETKSRARPEARRRAWESAAIALRRHQMPFGVFLGSMAMVALFYGNSFLALVLGAAVKLATNPIVLRMVLMFVAAGFAFIMGWLLMRRMRTQHQRGRPRFPRRLGVRRVSLHTYHAVIQQLKQQKHELQSLQLVERRRPRLRRISAPPCSRTFPRGVLFFTSNGLVRQANASAKQILGFASPAGMSADEIFRQADLISASDGAYANVADAINVSMREKTQFQRLEGAISHSGGGRPHSGYHGEFGACARPRGSGGGLPD